MQKNEKPSIWPLCFLLMASVMLIPLGRNVLWLSPNLKLILGSLAILGFVVLLRKESPIRRRKYLALATPLAILALAPINTKLDLPHVLSLGLCFLAVLILPPYLLKGQGVIDFRLWPKHLDWLDIGYTLLAIPLAWGAFKLYFYLSPAVPYNWGLSSTANNTELFSLFMGINAVGIWDELFFINICFAIIRSLFPFGTSNFAQAVIYTSVLYDMAFTGWGPLFIYILALTQGYMYERSKLLLWVIVVHLIVDYFLFQAIVETYYPNLNVWWH